MFSPANPDSLDIIVGLPIATTILAILYGLYNIYLHPLSKYPGPKLWSAYRLPHSLSIQSGHLHHRLKEFHDRHGPVVRVAPNELSYISADAWKDIYQNPFPRSEIRKKKSLDEPNAIMGNHEEDHARFRRAFMGALSENGVKVAAEVVQSHITGLISVLNDMCSENDDSAIIDIVAWANFLLFDIAGDLCFGESFGSVQSRKAHPWVDISCQFGRGLAFVVSLNPYPWVMPLLSRVMPAGMKQKMVYHEQLSAEKVKQRLASKVDRPDFISPVLRYNEGSKNPVTEAELIMNMVVFVFAASETTSTTTSAIFNHLLRNPKAFEKLKAEVRSSFHSEADITPISVAGLPYLTAVIHESLRLAPPSAIAMPPRIIPQGGATVCGQFVAGNTRVGVNQFPAFRSLSNFTSPDDFIPERFMETESFKEDDMRVYNPFLIGRHVCIGQKLAYVELRLIVARMVFDFDMQIADAENIVDWAGQKTYIFWEKEPFKVKLQSRIDKSQL